MNPDYFPHGSSGLHWFPDAFLYRKSGALMDPLIFYIDHQDAFRKHVPCDRSNPRLKNKLRGE
jgi:hypothetical protein